jgi:uncharacterized membrane protein
MIWDYGQGGMSWAASLAMSLAFVLFWGAIVTLVVWGVRGFRNDNRTSTSSKPTRSYADEVLSEQFARGEIDVDKFTHTRELLHSGTSHGP